MMENTDKTLDNLQVGDDVIVSNYHSKFVKKVTRLTNNFIVVGDVKYRKSDGCRAGDRRSFCSHIIVGDRDSIEHVKNESLRTKLIMTINNIPLQHLSNDQLQAIIDIAKNEGKKDRQK